MHAMLKDDSRSATMSVDDMATVLGISRHSAYDAVRVGALPALRVGRRWLVPRAALFALLGEKAMAAK